MAYTFLFSEGSIVITAYKNTIISTVAGTVLSVLMVAFYAYPLSRDNFKFRGFFTFYAFFTMLFGGGLVSYYMVMRQILQHSEHPVGPLPALRFQPILGDRDAHLLQNQHPR